MKRASSRFHWGRLAVAAGLLAAGSGSALAAHPIAVPLRGYDNGILTSASTQPYSPKLTCSSQNGNSSCHDYNSITNAYHFQQGRTNAAGAIAVSDTFSSLKPWILSAGMFGKW